MWWYGSGGGVWWVCVRVCVHDVCVAQTYCTLCSSGRTCCSPASDISSMSQWRSVCSTNHDACCHSRHTHAHPPTILPRPHGRTTFVGGNRMSDVRSQQARAKRKQPTPTVLGCVCRCRCRCWRWGVCSPKRQHAEDLGQQLRWQVAYRPFHRHTVQQQGLAPVASKLQQQEASTKAFLWQQRQQHNYRYTVRQQLASS